MAIAFVAKSVYAQGDTLLTDQLITEVKVVVKSLKSDKLRPTELQQLTDRFLSDIPQITMIGRGNFAQEPTIRGLNAGQINMTIDGMQIFGACTDRMDPISSYLEPNNLESVRLFTSPNGEDMAGSIGGGIDFKLRAPWFSDQMSWQGNLGTGFESNGWASQALGGLGFSSKRIAFLVNGTYRKSDNYYDGNGTEIKYSQYEKWNASANLEVKISKKHKLGLVYMQDEGYNIGYPALTMDVAYAKAKITSLGHEYHSNDRVLRHWESKLYWNFIDHAMDDTKRAPEEVAMHMDMPGTSRTIGFFTKARAYFGSRHRLQLSVNGFMNDLHAEMTMYPDIGAEMFMLTIPDTRRIQGGLNLSHKARIGDRWLLNTSLRSEYVSSSITTVIGRKTLTSIYTQNPDQFLITYNGSMSLNYRINNSFRTGIHIAHAMRSLTLQELYGFYLFNRADNYDFLGNPDLEAERSINVEWNLNFKQKQVTADLKVYSYAFNDYITGVILDDFSAMTIGATGVKQYMNIGNALISGFEGTLRYEILDNLELRSSNSFTYGRDQTGSSLPFIPPFKSINSISFKRKKLHANIEVIAAGDQSNVSTEKYGERVSKGYALLNVGAGYSFEMKGTVLNVSLKGANILDRVYYDHLDLLKVNNPGRNIMLRVGYSF